MDTLCKGNLVNNALKNAKNVFKAQTNVLSAKKDIN